jgi:ribosomal protein L10
MLKEQKERVVEQLAQRLRDSETLMVADYRGLTMPEIDELRSRLLEAGARFTVVKNTLTRRAAEAAGKENVLELIDGPTAIAFLEAEGDPVAVAKVLSETARRNDVLVIRGGVFDGGGALRCATARPRRRDRRPDQAARGAGRDGSGGAPGRGRGGTARGRRTAGGGAC